MSHALARSERLRMVLTWPAALILAPLIAQILIYIASPPLPPMTPLVVAGVGAGLAWMAGPRYRRMFWLWPLLMCLGGPLMTLVLAALRGPIQADYMRDLPIFLVGWLIPGLLGAALPVIGARACERGLRSDFIRSVGLGAAALLVGQFFSYADPQWSCPLSDGSDTPRSYPAWFLLTGAILSIAAGRRLWRRHWLWPVLLLLGQLYIHYPVPIIAALPGAAVLSAFAWVGSIVVALGLRRWSPSASSC